MTKNTNATKPIAFNARATATALDKFVTADRDSRKAMDVYATKLGAEFKRCEVTEKKGAAFSEARSQFYEAYGRRNGKLGLIRKAQKQGSNASDDARRAIGAAAKMWSKVSSAAIEGTTVEAQQYRAKAPVKAKGSASPKQGAASGGAAGKFDTLPDSADNQTGNPTRTAIVIGLGEQALQLANRIRSGDTPTEKELIAALLSIHTRAETATGKQIG